MLENKFDFGIHGSTIIETFYDGNLQPVRVPPNCVLDLSSIQSSNRRLFEPITNFLDEVKRRGKNSFYIQRTFALGDMLMLIPVVRHLRTLGFDPWIRTSSLFKDILKVFDIQIEFTTDRQDTNEFGISLDGTIERDHYNAVLSRMHRVHIYLEALGVKEMPKEVDWSCDLSWFPEVEVGDGEYIALQEGGSTQAKRLTEETINYIHKALEGKKVKVIATGNAVGRIAPTPLHLFTLIAKAKCLISMDSAPLWISHFTKTPVIAILGPSRPEERLTLHPLYPEGAVGIELNKEIGCDACFEHAEKCNSSFSCLKVPPKRICELLLPKVMRFWRGE